MILDVELSTYDNELDVDLSTSGNLIEVEPEFIDVVTPRATVSKTGTVTTLTVTDKDGVTTAQINDGAKGDKGDKGDPGEGIAPGGTAGQFLKKKSATDYDTEWGDVNSAEWGNITGELSDQEDLNEALEEKVDKVSGKGLSTNDYDDTEKQKVTDVYSIRHTHTNKSTLDGIDDTHVTKWNSALQKTDVINNVTSTTADAPLSANMGKELQDQITHLKSVGRFLSIWDCSTGLPTTEPTTLPYTYQTGDYFRVGTIATSGTNYKPSGAQYTSAASTTAETGTVKVGYVYYYDGTAWLLQAAGITDFEELTNRPKYNNTEMTGSTNIPEVKTSAWDAKSTVSVSATGTASEEVQYITIDGVEKKLPSGVTSFNYLENRPWYNGATMTGATNIPEVKTLNWDLAYDEAHTHSNFWELEEITSSKITSWDLKQDANLTTSISSTSTDEEYPSAKCVYDIVGNIESLLEALR